MTCRIASQRTPIATGDTPRGQAKAAKQDAGVDPDSVAAFASPKILTGLLVYPALMASDVLLYKYATRLWSTVAVVAIV